jgi:hypothetical protein
MNKYKIKIDKINIMNDIFSIISTTNINYVSEIRKGSVLCKIYNDDMKEISLNNLEEGDNITIYGNINKENNLIIIKKIKIKNKYKFINESSEDIDNI